MSGASNYTEANILNSLLRGVAFPVPSGTFVSLHTADPGDTGANEVSTGSWPAYVRRKAEVEGPIGTGWSSPSGGVSTNLKQLAFPAQNGAGSVTVSHFAVWDALSGGNVLTSAPLTTARLLNVGDIIVFDVGSLTQAVS